MGKEFSITPRDVPHVETKYRRIATPIPHPDSVATLEKLRDLEPQSMRGQPPIVWDRAEDCTIFDKYGNRWLDWSSGVLVTNAGHGAPEVRQASGMAGQKSWIVNEDPAIITAPFPDGFWQTDTSFDAFLAAVEARGMKPENVAGVIMETYQGVGPDFAPVEFVRKLREWCDQH